MGDIVSKLDRALKMIKNILVMGVREFPSGQELTFQGRTQEYIALFMQDRTDIVNLLISLYEKKKVLKSLEERPSRLMKNFYKDIQEYIGMAIEKRNHIDMAITALRSIQSSQNQKYDVMPRGMDGVEEGDELTDFLEENSSSISKGKFGDIL